MTALYFILAVIAVVAFAAATWKGVGRKVEAIAAGLALTTLILVITYGDRLFG